MKKTCTAICVLKQNRLCRLCRLCRIFRPGTTRAVRFRPDRSAGVCVPVPLQGMSSRSMRHAMNRDQPGDAAGPSRKEDATNAARSGLPGKTCGGPAKGDHNIPPQPGRLPTRQAPPGFPAPLPLQGGSSRRHLPGSPRQKPGLKSENDTATSQQFAVWSNEHVQRSGMIPINPT